MNLRSVLLNNMLLKVVSLILAVVAWFAVQGEQTLQESVEAPVEYVLPPELVLVADELPPDRVVIIASGTRAGLNKLRRASLRYLVDLETVGPGRMVHSFRAPPEGLPQDVSIETVSPAEIELVFDERMTETVPVQLRTRGELPTGFVQTEVSLTPEQVRLVGAKSELSELEQIRTAPFNLSGRREDFEGDIGLDLARLHVLPESARSVRLTYRVTEAVATRALGAVPILVDQSLKGLSVEPGACAIELKGPVPVLDAVARRGVEVRLVGDADLQSWGESETRRVGWTTELPDSSIVVRVQVLHPRADEVTVLSVEPRRFMVARSLPRPAEEPNAATRGEGVPPEE